MTKSELQAEALDNARNGQSVMNYAAIYSGFAAKGIAEADIRPRDNVLTFHAWKALGRSVKKGEHGVKVCTFVPIRDKDTGEVTGRRAHTTVVFHITQTETEAEYQARRASAGKSEYKPRPAGYYGHNKPVDSNPSWRKPIADYCPPDPGELAADRWNETH